MSGGVEDYKRRAKHLEGYFKGHDLFDFYEMARGFPWKTRQSKAERLADQCLSWHHHLGWAQFCKDTKEAADAVFAALPEKKPGRPTLVDWSWCGLGGYSSFAPEYDGGYLFQQALRGKIDGHQHNL